MPVPIHPIPVQLGVEKTKLTQSPSIIDLPDLPDSRTVSNISRLEVRAGYVFFYFPGVYGDLNNISWSIIRKICPSGNILYDSMAINDSSIENENHYAEVDDEEEFKNVHLPLFAKMREVRVLVDGTMICSCCHFESCGLFCFHQVAVAE